MELKLACFALIPNGVNEVLLKLRCDFGIWDLPGGCAEDSDFETGREYIETCLYREVEEETGLKVSIAEPLGSFWAEAIGHEIPSVQAIFICRIVSGNLRENAEAARFGWFGQNLPENTFALHRRVIEYWRETEDIRPLLAQQGLFLGGDLRGLVDVHRRALQ